MKFNVIFISMAIGLLSHSVISAPVDTSNNNNDVTDNDNNVEITPYHIDVPGADINIDDNGVQVEKKPQDNDDDTNDNKSAAIVTQDDSNDDNTSDDDSSTSTIEKRLFGNMDTLSVSSNGINSPAARLSLGNKNNDLADDDSMGLTKRRLVGGLSATRDGIDLTPFFHVGRNSGNRNMAAASDSDSLSKRDGTNDDDGADLIDETRSSTTKTKNLQALMDEDDDTDDDIDDDTDAGDVITKREQDGQGPPPPGLTAEQLDDYNTKKRDRIAAASARYPHRETPEDVADDMT